MKKFFSLVLALVMALSLTTIAWGADPTPVSDADELKAALAAGEDVIFENDIEVAATASTEGDLDNKVGIFVPAGVTVDGNGYTLTVTGAGGMLDDSIEDTAIEAVAGITVKNLTIVGGNRGIFIDGAQVSGSVTGNFVFDNVTILESCRAFNLSGGYAAGVKLTVSNSMLAGKISYSNEITTVDFVNCEFATNASVKGNVVEPWGSQTSFDNCVFAEGYEVNLDDAIAHDPAATIDMTDCVYAGEPLTADNMDDLVVASTTIPAGYVAAPTATPGAKVTFYAADDSADGWYLLDIFPGAEMSDFAMGADDNFLPCYEVPGYGYFTEVKAAAGSYKLVYGAKTVYLTSVDYTDVHYVAEGAKFTTITKEDDECGKLQVAAADLKKNFFVVVDIDDEDWYFVETKNGSIQLLVNGKIVDVEEADRHDLTAHAWAGYDVVNYAYTTVKCANCGKVATLYANGTAAGKDPFKVVVNGDTLGWITKAANGFGAVAPSGKPATDKVVESAQTFDAGIAMYVGMSVMAAAGSVVVFKKRED